MKASELRIGNLFKYSNNAIIKPEKRGVISSIIADDILFLAHSDNENLIEPILLTEEWLLKFGFEKTKIAGINFRLGNFVLNKISPIGRDVFFEAEWVPEIFDFDLRSHVRSNIIYVHQLQNLYFALSNKELEIIK